MLTHQDKVFIITGSSRGIGRATAEQLAQQGARVVISSRTQAACDEVAQTICNQGGQAIAIACHIGEQEQLINLVEKTVEHYGQINGLVCNAASNPVYGPMQKLELEAFNTIMHNNIWSQIELCRLCMPHIQKQNGGAIVLVSSIAGLSGQKMLGAYAISKAGEMQLARNLSLEYGPLNIRVNAVAPGLIRTDFSQALLADEKQVAYLERSLPAGRIGDPEDIAGVVGFLLSNAAAYVTGQTIVADGGMTIAQSM